MRRKKKECKKCNGPGEGVFTTQTRAERSLTPSPPERSWTQGVCNRRIASSGLRWGFTDPTQHNKEIPNGN